MELFQGLAVNEEGQKKQAFETKVNSLVELLRWRATKQANQNAYIFLEEGEEAKPSLTYETLDLQARAIATTLQTTFSAGERAILIYPPGLEYLAAFFGCLYGNIVAVPLPLPHPARLQQHLSRLLPVIQSAKPSMILTTSLVISFLESFFEQLMQTDPGLVTPLKKLPWFATDELAKQTPEDWKAPELNLDDVAYLQYTSGSTSSPKGVMLSHGNILHNLWYTRQKFEFFRESSVMGTWLPEFHDMGLVGDRLNPIYSGIPAYFMPTMSFLKHPIRWLKMISDYRVTCSGGPNFAYELCVNKISQEDCEGFDLSSWSVAYNGAEPIRKDTLERFADKFAHCGFQKKALFPVYGMAEATLLITSNKVGSLPQYHTIDGKILEQDIAKEANSFSKDRRDLVNCGTASEDVRILIVDPRTHEKLPEERVGEIWLQSPSVSLGYWENEKATKETFTTRTSSGEGPFLQTGDLGFLRQGSLFITGRCKDVLIIRGRNHYPQDLEWTAEKSHPSLRRGCSSVFSIHVDGEEKLVLVAEVERRYYERRQPKPSSGSEDERRANERRQKAPPLAINLLPDEKFDPETVTKVLRQAVVETYGLNLSQLVLVKPGTIPKTSSGKIQRYLCKERYLQGELKDIRQ